MCKVQFGNKVKEWERQRDVNRTREKNLEQKRKNVREQRQLKKTKTRVAIKIGTRAISKEDFDKNET